MIEGSIYQENVMILNLYGWNNMTPKHIKQTLIELQTKIDNFTIMTEDLEYLSQ